MRKTMGSISLVLALLLVCSVSHAQTLSTPLTLTCDRRTDAAAVTVELRDSLGQFNNVGFVGCLLTCGKSGPKSSKMTCQTAFQTDLNGKSVSGVPVFFSLSQFYVAAGGNTQSVASCATPIPTDGTYPYAGDVPGQFVCSTPLGPGAKLTVGRPK